MKFKAVLLVVLVFVVGLGLWRVAMAFSDEGSVRSSITASSFLPLDYIKESPVIEVELWAAIDEAKAWRADAQLSAISMRFNDGLDYDNLTHYSYTFESGSQHMIVGNSRVSSRPSAQTATDLFGDVQPNPVRMSYLKINFVQALEIVERAGGGAFRVEHPNTDATLLLIDLPDSVLNWYITYTAEDGTETGWIVNAASGFVEAGTI